MAVNVLLTTFCPGDGDRGVADPNGVDGIPEPVVDLVHAVRAAAEATLREPSRTVRRESRGEVMMPFAWANDEGLSGRRRSGGAVVRTPRG